MEYRDQLNLQQESFCYLAEVEGEIGDPAFTEEENLKGFEVKWLKLEDALGLLEKDKPTNYEGRFIQRRDSFLLTEAQRRFNENAEAENFKR